jgi:hypothetical protein
MKTIISQIISFFQKISKKPKNKLSLQQAIELKKQYVEEIQDLEEKANKLSQQITKDTISSDENFQQLITVLKLLDEKEKVYSELSNKIQVANVQSGNTENIKDREVLVRRRNILKRFPGEISLPTKVFSLKSRSGYIKNIISYLDKEIQNINSKLESINTGTFIMLT